MERAYVIILFSLLGIFVSFIIHYSLKREVKEKRYYGTQTSLVNYNFFLIPLFFIIFLVFEGFEIALIKIINFEINFVLFVSIYYVLLLISLKLLRKYVFPQVLVLLWTIPSFCYIFVYYRFSFGFNHFIAIPYDKNIFEILVVLWIFGFIGILAYKIIEHFKYRQYILQDSKEVKENGILEVFDEVLDKLNYKHTKHEIVLSNHVDSPITIGLLNKVIVLPNKKYEVSDLTLIFIHELIHIKRNDASAKLFLMICNALCWFNPLVCISSKKCFEDMELSCDYGVMNYLDESQRKQYANLILNNVSSEKGFTTCLSTSAKGLKYRLYNVLHPTNKYVLTILIGISFTLLSMIWGNFELVAKEKLTLDLPNYIFNEIEKSIDEEIVYCDVKDDKSLYEYIDNLELNEFMDQQYRSYDKVDCIKINSRTDNDTFNIALYGNGVIRYDYDYYYAKNMDWEYILNQLVEIPTLKIEFYNHLINQYVTLNEDPIKYNVDNQIIYEKEYTGHNIFALNGYTFDRVKLSLNCENISSIKVLENNQKELNVNDEGFVLVQLNMEYKVVVSMIKDNQVIDVEFMFDTYKL